MPVWYDFNFFFKQKYQEQVEKTFLINVYWASWIQIKWENSYIGIYDEWG